jgi:hypothetical protein
MFRFQSANLLFQIQPRHSSPSNFKQKGWTSTVTGYLYESDKLARLILRNMTYMDHPHTWAVTIKIKSVLTAQQIREMWPRVCRKLRNGGFVGLWVIEPHHKNTIHYHMIVSSHCSQLACLGNPDPVGMKVYCPTGKETFDDETTEEAPPRRDRGEAA